ncbi:hypothetical protein EZS27_036232, partial [termite gut metagenome]
DTLLVDSLFSVILSANRQNNFDKKSLYSYPCSKEKQLDSLLQKRGAHTLIIPQKGRPVKIESWNVILFRNTVVLHEKKQAEVVGDTLFIENIPVSEYAFSQDYYWMVSDNSVNLADSRLFGLVPQNHIIGKVFLIWFSKEKETGVFKGYRWNRFLKAL